MVGIVRRVLLLLLAVTGPSLADGTGDDVALGVILTLTGDGAERDAAIAHGYVAAAEHINAAGGIVIAGERRSIRLEFMDDRGSPRRAAALADVLVRWRGVTVFLGGGDPVLTQAVAADVADVGFPVFDPLGVSPADTDGIVLSVVPRARDRLVAVLAGLSVGYTIAGQDTSRVAVSVAAGSARTADTLAQAAADLGFAVAGFAVDGHGAGNPGILIYGPSLPAQPARDRLVVSLTCEAVSGDAGARMLCADHWPSLRDTATVPDWLAALDEAGTRDAALTLAALSTAMSFGRSAHGPVIADVLHANELATPGGPVLLSDGANIAGGTAVFAVSDGIPVPFRASDPLGDPLGLSGIE